MKKEFELNEKELEKVNGGAEKNEKLIEFDEQKMLERSGKGYAKDILDDVPPGSSAIVLFDEEG